MSFSKRGYVDPEPRDTGLLEEGEYVFKIEEISALEEMPNENERLCVKLLIEGKHILSFLYSGIDKKGAEFDMISPFCRSIGIKPTSKEAINTDYWQSLVGKKGICQIRRKKQELGKNAGKIFNEVWYFIAAKSASGSIVGGPGKSYLRKDDPDNVDPDDIPF